MQCGDAYELLGAADDALRAFAEGRRLGVRLGFPAAAAGFARRVATVRRRRREGEGAEEAAREAEEMGRAAFEACGGAGARREWGRGLGSAPLWALGALPPLPSSLPGVAPRGHSVVSPLSSRLRTRIRALNSAPQHHLLLLSS